MRSLPNFAWLKAFEAAARLESFNLAAEELHLTPSAISHQVKNLEQHLGKPLFVREHRQVSLNEHGQQFYQALVPLIEGFSRACREIQDADGGADVLTVHCAPSLAVKWLGPRLNQFMRANPAFAIHLRTDAVAPDLRKVLDVDCVISYGQAPASDEYLVVEALAAEPLVPVCAPALCAQLQDRQGWYKELPLIDSALSPVTWVDWFGSKGIAVPVGPRLSFDRGAMAVAAPWCLIVCRLSLFMRSATC